MAEFRKIFIGKNNISKYKIFFEKDCTICENYSATELQRYIRKTCNISLAIVNESNSFEYLIIVGRSKYESYYNIDRKYLTTDGFIIKSIGNNLVIAGGGDRGTLYGVYSFLENYVGWRFFTSEMAMRGMEIGDYMLSVEKNIGDGDIIITNDLDYKDKPVIKYRDGFGHATISEDWCAKNKINGETWEIRKMSDKLGGAIRFAGSAGHTFALLVPQNKYYDSHPEYFAMRDGVRMKSKSDIPDQIYDPQLCLTNNEVPHVIANNIREFMKKNPDANIVSVSQNDNEFFCQCPQCLKAYKERGELAAVLFDFVNKVAIDLEKDYPNLKIHTYSYSETSIIPKEVTLHKNILLQYCLRSCHGHALNDKYCKINSKIKEKLKYLGERCQNLYIYDYRCCITFSMLMFPDIFTLLSTMRSLAECNVQGVYSEFDVYSYNVPTMEELRAYLFAKITWNPYMSQKEYDGHINEFLEGYYGKGWRYIRKYLEYWAEISKDVHIDTFYGTITDNEGKLIMKPDGGNLKACLMDKSIVKDVCNKIYKMFDKAIALANVDETQRIEIARTAVIWYELFWTMDDIIKNGNEYEKNIIIARNRNLCERIRRYCLKHTLFIGMSSTTHMYENFSLPTSQWNYWNKDITKEVFLLGV